MPEDNRTPSGGDSQIEQDNEWLDEVLRQSFPASDPIPMGHARVDATRATDTERSDPSD
jgi:hypothetical protein